MKSSCAILLLTFIAFACAKDHSCYCKITQSGYKTTHTQTAGIPIIFPGTDTTTTEPYLDFTTSRTNYKRTGKRAMKKLCFESSEETIEDRTTNTAPGLYTITTTNSGRRKLECTIE
jgi:hypothetical protein